MDFLLLYHYVVLYSELHIHIKKACSCNTDDWFRMLPIQWSNHKWATVWMRFNDEWMDGFFMNGWTTTLCTWMVLHTDALSPMHRPNCLHIHQTMHSRMQSLSSVTSCSPFTSGQSSACLIMEKCVHILSIVSFSVFSFHEPIVRSKFCRRQSKATFAKI